MYARPGHVTNGHRRKLDRPQPAHTKGGQQTSRFQPAFYIPTGEGFAHVTVVDSQGWASAKELGWALFEAVETHSRERRLLDDLTVLALRRLPPLPIQTVAVV